MSVILCAVFDVSWGELVSSFPAGKFVQHSHGGQAYPPGGMESYMPQGMDPSMHPSARKAPGNPQASMGYGQVHYLKSYEVYFVQKYKTRRKLDETVCIS